MHPRRRWSVEVNLLVSVTVLLAHPVSLFTIAVVLSSTVAPICHWKLLLLENSSYG